jgi:hypothetical protein
MHNGELRNKLLALKYSFQPATSRCSGMATPGAAFAGDDLGHPRLDRLLGHAGGQHRQWMAQINHVVDARAKKLSVAGQANIKNSQKMRHKAY